MISTTRLLAPPFPSLPDHERIFGPRRSLPIAELISELDSAALDGRGGAGFPAHRKLAAVASRSVGGTRPIVVGNGSEGEPLSGKDAALLTIAPHLVLDGMAVCAEALDAEEMHLVVDARTERAVRAAIAERDDRSSFSVRVAARGFVGGEASAVVSALGGGRQLPVDRPVRLAVSGLRRRPTLVQNVETFAHIALIARYGADWHRRAGTADDPGTRLASVSWGSTTPRVLEVPGGTPVGEILQVAGAPRPAAVLVGGFHGAWVPASALSAPLSRAGLAPWDASPGAGVLHVLVEGECGVRVTAGILATLAAASAGQCGPCVNGLPRLAELMRDLLGGRDTTAELARVAGLVDGRGACHHPDASVRMLRSALRVFDDDVAAHVHGRCAARKELAR